MAGSADVFRGVGAQFYADKRTSGRVLPDMSSFVSLGESNRMHIQPLEQHVRMCFGSGHNLVA